MIDFGLFEAAMNTNYENKKKKMYMKFILYTCKYVKINTMYDALDATRSLPEEKI